MPLLALRNISKRFGDAIRRSTTSRSPSSRARSWRSSGAAARARSTLLRCINGLERPDGGTIEFDGESFAPTPRRLKALRREIGIVFQSYNLFPHLSVERNITLGPTVAKGMAAGRRQGARPRGAAHGRSRGQDRAPIRRALRRPAAARRDRPRLAMEPRLMLFDEITAALDAELIGEVVKVLESAGARRHDDGAGHPRDGLRAAQRRHDRLHASGPDLGERARRRSSSRRRRPPSSPRSSVPSSRSSPGRNAARCDAGPDLQFQQPRADQFPLAATFLPYGRFNRLNLRSRLSRRRIEAFDPDSRLSG